MNSETCLVMPFQIKKQPQLNIQSSFRLALNVVWKSYTMVVKKLFLIKDKFLTMIIQQQEW